MFTLASMQDLRGSELVGGNFDKNNEVFATCMGLYHRGRGARRHTDRFG